MKNTAKIIVSTCCAFAVLLTGCIDETIPTHEATTDQLGASAKSTEALLWSMPAFYNNYNSLERDLVEDGPAHFDFGYGSIMRIRDVMTEDFVTAVSTYDHFSPWAVNKSIDETNKYYPKFVWNYLWKFVQTANDMVGAINAEDASGTQLNYLGVGHAFRAFVYLDLARMFEFLETDKVKSVNASGNNVLNLTVPIVTDTVSQGDARNNPRVPRQEMFDFILSDLDLAEDYLKDFNRPTKTLPNLAVVYGLKARLYMWVEDYANAKEYARKAIDTGGHPPLNKSQWLNTTTGFNSLSAPSWMWGSKMQAEDDAVKTGIINWTSFMSNEIDYGYAGPSGELFIMIAPRAYDRISDDDFRKLSWKAPRGSALDGENTYISPEYKDAIPDYGSLKFRPGDGNGSDSNVGSACDFPTMRIEEMYFIEAEAAAHLGAGQGMALLTSFMKAYRYDGYQSNAASVDAVIEEIIFQKRVEFWGEGLIYFDYKRLNKPVIRGYKGTPHTDDKRFNTDTRPAWMNFCIHESEKYNNLAIIGYENPNPVGCYELWVDK